MSKRIAWLAPGLLAACSLAYLLPPYLYMAWAALPPGIQPALEPLAYYAQAHRLDPIFAIEGTDPAALRAALSIFFNQRSRIAELYTTGQGRVIASSLYPDEFLLLLPDLEAARQTLLAKPTATHAKKYHALLLETISAYAAGARATARTLKSASATVEHLSYIGGTANTSEIASKLETVASLALLQKEKETMRYDCIKHFSAQCPSLEVLAQKRDQLLAEAPQPLPPPPQGALRADELLQQILPLLPKFKYASKAVYVIPSDCFVGQAAYLREYYNEWTLGKVARKQAVLNNVYFYDIQKEAEKNPKAAVLQELVRAGVALQYQNIGNEYMCPDSGFDAHSVGRIVGVLEKIGTLPHSTEEQRLLNLRVLHMSSIALYVRTKAHEHTEAGDALAETYIEGSAGFDEVILSLYSDNRFLAAWDKAQNPVRYEYLLATRNYASTLFLMGNPTFVHKKISLFSTMTPSPLSRMYLREYLGDVSAQYTDAHILAQVKSSIAIEEGSELRAR